MHAEFLLLYILGFSFYEFLLKRYYNLSEKNYFMRGITALASISLFTIKYYSWIIFGGTLSVLVVWYLAEKIIKTFLSDSRFLAEQFLAKTIVIAILFMVLGSVITTIESNRWFDMIWNRVIEKHIGTGPKILLYSISYIFVIDGGTMIVKGILSKFPMLTQRALEAISRGGKDRERRYRQLMSRSEQENAGEVIGIIERILILTFVLVGSYEAVAFSVAAKSIARFNELDDKYFAEYYLLGTSISVSIAVVVGVIIKMVAL
jgi:hypothetical protein